ncbi:hypothetical protein DN051_35400 [Streptomyces cadmiisoli]|uniref:Uncharacterized protein n=1 Tax=Streptomyces cadmiisoli TaxID=2184053 RepID=A0A2Z4J841_9ACTN|nr:hypothetical protein DN051_35400 [Streptomyces cadmiisoli]
MPPLAAPAESPSTSSTRTSGRHTESTHRTPLLDRQTLPAAALARLGSGVRPCPGKAACRPRGPEVQVTAPSAAMASGPCPVRPGPGARLRPVCFRRRRAGAPRSHPNGR